MTYSEMQNELLQSDVGLQYTFRRIQHYSRNLLLTPSLSSTGD